MARAQTSKPKDLESRELTVKMGFTTITNSTTPTILRLGVSWTANFWIITMKSCFIKN